MKKNWLTRVKLTEYECVWTIEEVRNICSKVGLPMISPTFKTGEKDELEWAMSLYLGGYDQEHEDYVGIRICPNENPTNANFFKLAYLKIAVIDKMDRKTMTINRVIGKDILNKDTGIIKYFALRSYLFENLLVNDKLKIACRISTDDVVDQIFANKYMLCPPLSVLHCRNAHMDNYKNLLNSEKFSDFKLKVKDMEIPVHKAILAAHSRVFAAMFNSDMRERRDNFAQIEDVDVEVMQKLLRFVYVGHVDNLNEIADKLLMAADKYELDGLKIQCEKQLGKQLHIDNVYDYLRLADDYRACKLKNAAIKFLHNNAQKLADSEDFKESIRSFSPDLLADILGFFMAQS